MRLYTTDETYVVSGKPRPGVPFLCDDDMELVEAPNAYLDHIAVVRGRTRAPNTWSTYADHLYDYFAFLEANELDWEEADERIVATWRDVMVERGNSAGTVNGRLRGVQRFYAWAQKRGLVDDIPFDTASVTVGKPVSFLSHVDAKGGRRSADELTLPEVRKLPKFLTVDRSTAFLDALTPKRVRLMGYTMLLVGLRREEAAGLDYRVLPNPAGMPSDRALDMILDPNLTPTKGSRERLVKVPYLLAQALYEYFTWERPVLERKHLRVHGVPSTKLFLTEYGEELSIDAVSVQFNEASKKCGIKCTPHMLRHSFGTYEFLRISQTQGKDRALWWVRDRLGHSSILTTEVYLHLADTITFDAIDGYVDEICEALARGN